jgi:hypothetical protein
LSTVAAKLRRLFNFHLLFYYDMAEALSLTFNPGARRFARSFNFNHRHQLHPLQLQSSLPTSSLVAANFNPHRHSNSKPRRCAISSILLDGRCGVLDATASR